MKHLTPSPQEQMWSIGLSEDKASRNMLARRYCSRRTHQVRINLFLQFAYGLDPIQRSTTCKKSTDLRMKKTELKKCGKRCIIFHQRDNSPPLTSLENVAHARKIAKGKFLANAPGRGALTRTCGEWRKVKCLSSRASECAAAVASEFPGYGDEAFDEIPSLLDAKLVRDLLDYIRVLADDDITKICGLGGTGFVDDFSSRISNSHAGVIEKIGIPAQIFDGAGSKGPIRFLPRSADFRRAGNSCIGDSPACVWRRT